MAATKNARNIKIDTKEYITTALLDLLKKAPLQDLTMQVEAFYGGNGSNYHITFIAAGAYAVWKKWLLGGNMVPLEDVMRTLGTFHEVLHSA